MKSESKKCTVFVALDVPNEGGFIANCDLERGHKGGHMGQFDSAAEYYAPKKKSKKYPDGCFMSSVILNVSWPNLEG